MNSNQENLLETIKQFSVDGAMLVEFNAMQLGCACSAWSMCGASIEDMNEYSDDCMELWEHCRFDGDKWISLMPFLPPPRFLYKLIHSNLIYPDGTYNREWLEVKIIEEQERGKQWKKK